MDAEHERWAEALQVEKMHGDRALMFAAERIGALIEARDPDGVERWREIYTRLVALRRGDKPPS